MSTIATSPQLTTGFFETGETDEAAALRTLGVDPILGAECRVDHDAKNPYSSGRGVTVFALEKMSKYGRRTRDLSQAYRCKDGRHSAQLDDAIARIANADLRNEIEGLLQMSIAEHLSANAEQRHECLKLHHAAPRFAKGRRGDGRKYTANIKNTAFKRRFL